MCTVVQIYHTFITTITTMAPSSIVAARKRVVNKTKQSGNKKQKHDFRRDKDDEDDNDSDTEFDKKEHKDDDSDDDKNNNKKSTENSFENHVAEKEQQVSDKNVTGIIDLLLDDAPATELPGTLEASIKHVVDTALFRGVKFYKTPKSASRVVGYVFTKINMGENIVEQQLFRRLHWSVICNEVTCRTAELRQQCIERWYAVGYGKFKIPETTNFFRNVLTPYIFISTE